MEEMEVPTEKLHETIEEEVEEAVKKNERKGGMAIAISTALMADFAAMASLLAGHHADEAVIEQIRASDKWAFYQAKGIKDEILSLSNNPDKRPICRRRGSVRLRLHPHDVRPADWPWLQKQPSGLLKWQSPYRPFFH